jgi:2-amino-4-hydroxy-6-hydroxymethyldihydropteridine diphosphokinase
LPIVYLGMGSNVGLREEQLKRSIKELGSLPHTEVLDLSSLYETEPVGVKDQPWFLNIVSILRTAVPPEELLLWLQKIESQMGRGEGKRWGPRLIDLDILLYDSLVFSSSRLVIPHPRMHQRSFVLLPLAEVVPQWRHPILGKGISQLAEELPLGEVVRWRGKLYA